MKAICKKDIKFFKKSHIYECEPITLTKYDKQTLVPFETEVYSIKYNEKRYEIYKENFVIYFEDVKILRTKKLQKLNEHTIR